jgi:photoactive yellow protein
VSVIATFPASLQRILESSLDDSVLNDLLEALPIGVIVLDVDGRVLRYNAYEQALARRTAAQVIGKYFFTDVAPCTAVSDLLPAFQRWQRDGGDMAVDIAFSFPFPHVPAPREVSLRLRGFSSNGARYAFLLVEDITEEVQARRLRELLAMLVAHDMKNPLTAIRLNVDMVLREAGTGTRATERLSDARVAADRLDRMIRLFLDVYRLEHADLVVARAPLDPLAVVGEAVRLQQPVADSYGVTLSVEGNAATFDGDAGLLVRMLENLIDNGLRHARHAMQVVVRDVPGALEIDVIDDGPGVPADARARIFDKFATMSADLRGYNQGLGLTFCSLAANRLGGTVTVHDSVPNGATFRIRLARELLRDQVGQRGVERHPAELVAESFGGARQRALSGQQGVGALAEEATQGEFRHAEHGRAREPSPEGARQLVHVHRCRRRRVHRPARPLVVEGEQHEADDVVGVDPRQDLAAVAERAAREHAERGQHL